MNALETVKVMMICSFALAGVYLASFLYFTYSMPSKQEAGVALLGVMLCLLFGALLSLVKKQMKDNDDELK